MNEDELKKKIPDLPDHWQVAFALHCARIILDDGFPKMMPKTPSHTNELKAQLSTVELEVDNLPVTEAAKERLSKVASDLARYPSDPVPRFVAEAIRSAIYGLLASPKQSADKTADEKLITPAQEAYQNLLAATTLADARGPSWGRTTFVETTGEDFEKALEHLKKIETEKDLPGAVAAKGFPQRFFADLRSLRSSASGS